MPQDLTEIPVPPALGPDPDPDPPPGGRVRPDAGEPGGASRHRPARGPVSGAGAGMGQRVRNPDDRRCPDRLGGGSARTGTRPARRRGGGGRTPAGTEWRPKSGSSSRTPIGRFHRKAARPWSGSGGRPTSSWRIPRRRAPWETVSQVRRVVVRGAPEYLKRGGVLLLSVSTQYGAERVRGLVSANPGFVHEGVAATTDLAKLRSSGPGPSPRSPPRRAGRRAASRGSVLPGTMVRRRARLVVWRRLIPLSHLGVGLEAGSPPKWPG